MSADDDLIRTMHRAVAAVRREGYKAALIYAVIDGTILGLLAVLAVTLLDVGLLPPRYAAAVVGLIGAAATFVYRVRQPIVERFEAVNPEVHEALRTARDALADDDTSPMARALYADVIDRLQRTSSIGLLELPRVGARLVVLLALSVAVIQASLLGIEVGAAPASPSPGGGGSAGAATGSTSTPAGLQPPDDVLGEPETVTPGGQNLSAELRQQAGQGDDDRQREYETGGLGDDTAVEAERAGYAPPDDLENAALIKAYNLRIREETDDGR